MTVIIDESHVPEALFAVQTELQKQVLVKDATNPFHNSKYLTLKTLLDIVMPILEKHEILLLQMPSHIDGTPALRTALVDTKANAAVETVMPLMLKSEDPQAQGSAITYARRYSLMSMLGLVAADEDDDGNHATAAAQTYYKGPTPTKQEQPATDAQVNLMFNTVKKKGFTNDQAHDILCAMAEVDEVGKINKSQASKLIEQLFTLGKKDLEGWLDN